MLCLNIRLQQVRGAKRRAVDNYRKDHRMEKVLEWQVCMFERTNNLAYLR
jgi:hypothetical protein